MDITNRSRIFFNGTILTMEDDLPTAEAIAITGNKIVCLGKKEDVLQQADVQTEFIDLHGRTLIPGLIETHMHLTMVAEYLLEIDVKDALNDSIANMCAAISQVASQKAPGEWILGGGWDERFFAEQRIPTRWDLDKAAPDHPVVMRRVCTHKWSVNSKALELAHIDKNTPNPPGGIINKDPLTGEPNGILEENALALIPVPDYNLADLKAKIHAVQQDLVAKGVTTATDITVTKQGLRAYQELAKANTAPCRIRFWAPALTSIGRNGLLEPLLAIGMESGYGDDWVRFQGIKLFTDGTITGSTAGFEEDFINTPGRNGCLFLSDEEMTDALMKAAMGNIRVALHAMGDRSVGQVIRCFQAVTKQKDITKMRNRIEHSSYIRPEQMEQMKELGLVASLSTGFINPLGDHYFMTLDENRVRKLYPAKSLLQHGLIVSGNADCPICDFNAFPSIYGAVSRRTHLGVDMGQEEAITVEQGLKLYTINAAKACFDEENIGSLKAGKYADLTVLEKNPLTASLEEVKDMRVLATITDGKLVYGSLDNL